MRVEHLGNVLTHPVLIAIVDRRAVDALRDAVRAMRGLADLDHVRDAQRAAPPALGETILVQVVAPFMEADDVLAAAVAIRERRGPPAAAQTHDLLRRATPGAPR